MKKSKEKPIKKTKSAATQDVPADKIIKKPVEIKKPGKPPTKKAVPEPKPEPIPEKKPRGRPSKKKTEPELPVKPAEIKPVKPVEIKAIKPEIKKPVKPAEIKPVKPVEIKPIKPEIKKPVKPAAAPKPVAQKPAIPLEEKKAPVKPVEQKPEPAAPVIQKPEPVIPKIITPDKIVKINELTTVRELSEKFKLSSPAELIKKLLISGVFASINQRLDADTASIIAQEFGYAIEFVPLYSEESAETETEDIKNLIPRAPVVTVMGHVDHGKTSLLDAIRESNVAASESGQITQHIGAYRVKTNKGEIVFLDTPGHEAFTAMRARGAKATDIVILVVAADDGVMPQTLEAIDHARSANVPIIVAINKIDIPTANVHKIKQQLSGHGLLADDWGGDVYMQEVSARNKINIDKLLDLILFRTELLDLKANPNKPARGTIIEAKLDPKRGPVATVLINTGTLKVGNVFICGISNGKVRAMINDSGKRIDSAGPSTPVEIMGFSNVPLAGDKFVVIESEQTAREIISRRQELIKKSRLTLHRHISLKDLATGKIKKLNLLLKTDVQGSLEAVRDTLDRISIEDIQLKIIHNGVGAITASDVNLAILTDSIIAGFHVKIDSNAEIMAKQEGVDIRLYNIIFELIDDIKKAMHGMLDPVFKEIITGRAEVRKVFQLSDKKVIAGSLVTEGKFQRNAKTRVVRGGAIVLESTVSSLKRLKDDVKEVEKGYECGIGLENVTDIKPKDILESYILEEQKNAPL